MITNVETEVVTMNCGKLLMGSYCLMGSVLEKVKNFGGGVYKNINQGPER